MGRVELVLWIMFVRSFRCTYKDVSTVENNELFSIILAYGKSDFGSEAYYSLHKDLGVSINQIGKLVRAALRVSTMNTWSRSSAVNALYKHETTLNAEAQQ